MNKHNTILRGQGRETVLILKNETKIIGTKAIKQHIKQSRPKITSAYFEELKDDY